MKTMVLWFALAMLPSAAIADQQPPAPPPSSSVTTMQNMPSQEQIFKLFQKRAAAARDGLRRFRTAMLEALTPDHRATIGLALGQYALADSPDKNVLIASIDAVLSQSEREGIADAMTAYVAEQEVMRPAFEADFAQEFPDLAKSANPSPTQAPLPKTPASMSATTLANWLLAPQPKPIETMTYSQISVVTPFNWGDPDTEQLEKQLRSEVLGALSQSDRSKVAQAIAEYAVSNAPNQADLAKRIDSVLSAPEQQQILESYAAFAAAQKAAFSQSQARFEAMQLQMPPNAPKPMTQAMNDTAGTAGEVLLQALMGGTRVTAQFIRGMSEPGP